jgi:hypothetical protein
MSLRQWKPSVGVLAATAAVVVILGLGTKSFFERLSGSVSLSFGVNVLALGKAIHAYKGQKGTYPVATDLPSLRMELGPLLREPDSWIADAGVIYSSDGRSYRLAYFPCGFDEFDDQCGTFVASNGRLVGFPRVLDKAHRTTMQGAFSEFAHEAH